MKSVPRRLGHLSAVTLATWVLLHAPMHQAVGAKPQELDADYSAPLSEWVAEPTKFESEADCKQAEVKEIHSPSVDVGFILAAMKTMKCVPSDNPGLRTQTPSPRPMMRRGARPNPLSELDQFDADQGTTPKFLK